MKHLGLLLVLLCFGWFLFNYAAFGGWFSFGTGMATWAVLRRRLRRT
jgi:hypothetical protein